MALPDFDGRGHIRVVELTHFSRFAIDDEEIVPVRIGRIILASRHDQTKTAASDRAGLIGQHHCAACAEIAIILVKNLRIGRRKIIVNSA
jgi:hypothetical protein